MLIAGSDKLQLLISFNVYLRVNLKLSIRRSCELSFIDCTEDSVYVQVTELRKGDTIDMDEETGINTSEESSWAYQDG